MRGRSRVAAVVLALAAVAACGSDAGEEPGDSTTVTDPSSDGSAEEDGGGFGY